MTNKTPEQLLQTIIFKTSLNGCRIKGQGQVEDIFPRIISQGGSEDLQNNVGYCHCSWLPPELDGKTPLLKAPYTLVTGHGEIKLALARKLLPW